jgi:hypothetical protein
VVNLIEEDSSRQEEDPVNYSIREENEEISKYFLKPKLKSFIDERLKVVIEHHRQREEEPERRSSFFKTNLHQLKQIRDIRYLKQLREFNSKVLNYSEEESSGGSPLEVNGENLTIKYAPKMKHVFKR